MAKETPSVDESRRIALANFYRGAHGSFETDLNRAIGAATLEERRRIYDISQEWVSIPAHSRTTVSSGDEALCVVPRSAFLGVNHD